mmetsp:Transcript_4368/g.16075  ORF Transcript_4368/g.16075 Transcript_4368/m.16075 type:complete len:257 (-) Transcript_4368:509-1279(-)
MPASVPSSSKSPPTETSSSKTCTCWKAEQSCETARTKSRSFSSSESADSTMPRPRGKLENVTANDAGDAALFASARENVRVTGLAAFCNFRVTATNDSFVLSPTAPPSIASSRSPGRKGQGHVSLTVSTTMSRGPPSTNGGKRRSCMPRGTPAANVASKTLAPKSACEETCSRLSPRPSDVIADGRSRLLPRGSLAPLPRNVSLPPLPREPTLEAPSSFPRGVGLRTSRRSVAFSTEPLAPSYSEARTWAGSPAKS